MRQLTGLDASFLALERANMVGHVTGVLVLDTSSAPEPWTYDRFRAHLLSRITRIGPFTSKLVEVPLGLDRPYWISDPDFDIDYHLRHVAVPGGGSRDEFSALVARIHARPLDRRRPLWECYVVEGAPGGHTALITKIHHAAIDGLSGQEILAALVDLEPEAPVVDEPSPVARERPMSSREVLGRTAVSLLTSPVRMMRVGLDLARAVPVIGPTIGRNAPVARGDETTRELLAHFGTAPHVPFNATIGPHRRWAYVSIPLDDVKAVKNAAGTTVNDVILSIVSGVLRTWLEHHGGIPDRPLAAMVPLSVRQSGQERAVGNFISPTVATLATHLEDAGERLAAIHAGMKTAKERHGALPADILTDITQAAPPAVAALAARLVASTKLANRLTLPFNLVVSNVPGPPIPLYLAGARVLGHYPVSAIVDGVGLNVTVVTTNDMLDFGFVSDRDLVPDLWSMADSVPAALKTLADAIGTDVRR